MEDKLLIVELVDPRKWRVCESEEGPDKMQWHIYTRDDKKVHGRWYRFITSIALVNFETNAYAIADAHNAALGI